MSVCDSCIETAFESGFGDLQSRESPAIYICKKEGDNFPVHTCSKQNTCECACLDEFEREWLVDDDDN